jgi:TRAP-type C4-dicarboxylate transport system substrate-binding protein
MVKVGHTEEVIKLKYSNYFPAANNFSYSIDLFCEDVKKRTNGRVEITPYHGGTLTTGPRMYDGVVHGLSDLGTSHTSYTQGRFPVSDACMLPLGFQSAWVSTKVLNDFFNEFKPKEWNDVHVLYLYSIPPFYMHTTKPVRTMDDMKGLKIRAPGLNADITKALGGIPVNLQMGDVYDAARRGVIDGIYVPTNTMYSFKFGEVFKYRTLSTYIGGAGVFYVVMNKDKWNSLPADIKMVFDELSDVYAGVPAMIWDNEDRKGAEFLKRQGGETFVLSDAENTRWEKAVEVVIKNYKEDMVKKGYSKDEVESFVNFVKERIVYWRKLENLWITSGVESLPKP